MTSRPRTKWNYTSEEALARQIDATEIYERKQREEEEKNAKWTVPAENQTEHELTRRIDYAGNPIRDNSDIRAENAKKLEAKIQKVEDKYIGKWEAENRRTLKSIRQMEEDIQNDNLLTEQRKLQAQIAQLQKVAGVAVR